jgi:TolB-like protein
VSRAFGFRNIPTLLLTLAVILSIGCAGSNSTTFVHPDYSFQYLEKVAVVPFDNLSTDKGAGARVSRVFVTDLLAEQVFDVVEPGEVSRVMMKYNLVRTSELTTEQIIEMGKALGVQGIILGTVNESASVRSGSSISNTVTLVVRMVETETGTTVWSTSKTRSGKGFWSSLFGTGGKSLSEVTNDCVKAVLNSLID